jgi:hypothetical protein
MLTSGSEVVSAAVGDLPVWLTGVAALGVAVVVAVWRLPNVFGLPRIDILKDVKPKEVTSRETLARKHPSPLLPELPYTESTVDWVLLYDHARVGQIQPDKIRRMKREDLEYLAGMKYPHPDLLETEDENGKRLPKSDIENRRGQLTKLQGNVDRAANELARRTVVRTAMLSAVVGAFFGALAAVVLSGT